MVFTECLIGWVRRRSSTGTTDSQLSLSRKKFLFSDEVREQLPAVVYLRKVRTGRRRNSLKFPQDNRSLSQTSQTPHFRSSFRTVSGNSGWKMKMGTSYIRVTVSSFNHIEVLRSIFKQHQIKRQTPTRGPGRLQWFSVFSSFSVSFISFFIVVFKFIFIDTTFQKSLIKRKKEVIFARVQTLLNRNPTTH